MQALGCASDATNPGLSAPVICVPQGIRDERLPLFVLPFPVYNKLILVISART